ncbi:MAG: GNAT family N-acetyltransferase [Pseudomonadota bacterium]|nr:GNAT family N-acetyltransferase [Pseudomonadota bacterium]
MNVVDATEKDLPRVRALFREYQRSLDVDLCFQGFEQELASLPGAYAPPRGFILLAVNDGDAVGCVGVRPLTTDEAELKRLYVQPQSRGQRVGKTLFLAAMSKAEALGYGWIVLDTLTSMHEARSLYLGYGFERIPTYDPNPEESVEYYRYQFVSS